MSTDLHTLSGAYALHALSSEEAEEFQKHLDACPACRQEVKELQQAAAQMGASEAIRPPAHLKARVMAAADQMPQMPPRVSRSNVIEVPRGRWGARLLAAAAAVVVIVAGVVGIGVLQSEDEPSTRLASGVVEVFQAEDAHTATMDTANGGKISVATSPSLNQMAVDTDELPALDDKHVYQLWAIEDGAIASVGVLEPEKGAFMDMPGPKTEVAITIEPAGGSQQPTTDPIMQVEPAAV
ncbi:anti-sigma factor [Nocardioides sp. WL0053]|uniref:Regulator of SigK n=1 Tax=Nocardioides jiangsuensis TaxID=2866161 RepID=A0ABS7RNL8_9ACTN|nr:anti-sigma factor [Nocardioides jiangsuensis]MBY9076650.1 anti-sigma factor [Nocardioides jiangsuensis]